MIIVNCIRRLTGPGRWPGLISRRPSTWSLTHGSLLKCLDLFGAGKLSWQLEGKVLGRVKVEG